MTNKPQTPTPKYTSQRFVWPAERFYWGVVDGSLVRGARGRRRRQQIGYLFESYLPVPVESVHFVCGSASRKSAHILVCGLDRSALECLFESPSIDSEDESPGPVRTSVSAAIGGGHLLSVQPDRIPDCVCASFEECAITPESLNLLSGEYEPDPLRRARSRVYTAAVAILSIIVAIFLLGMERRTRHYAMTSQAFARARAALLDSVLRDDHATESTTAPSLPPELRLQGELRLLRNSAVQTLDPPTDRETVVEGFAALLSHWPETTEASAQSVIVSDSAMTVNSNASNVTEANKLLESLKDLTLWRMEAPDVSPGRDGVQARIRFTRNHTQLGEQRTPDE